MLRRLALKTKLLLGLHANLFKKNKQAQVSIEMTVGIISAVILLIGISRLFVWLNQSLVERQEAYENIRQTGILIIPKKYAVTPINNDELMKHIETGQIKKKSELTEEEINSGKYIFLGNLPKVEFYKPKPFYIFSQEESKEEK